ncbi:hypothetical protein [Bifidobacterium vansinderenii]|nr:hypothetical protein [Bifidobacterium vansinderenii]
MLDCIYRWKGATTVEAVRFGGWSMNNRSRVAKRLRFFEKEGLLRSSKEGTTRTVWLPRPRLREVVMSQVPPASSVKPRQHELGLASLASQMYAGVDVLGLGDEWPTVLDEMQYGESGLIAEREYNTSLRKWMKQYTNEDGVVDDIAVAAKFDRIRRGIAQTGRAPAYNAWLMQSAGEGYEARDGSYRTGQDGMYQWVLLNHDLALNIEALKQGNRNLDEIVDEAANHVYDSSWLRLTDHPVDMILARPDKRSIGVELELTPKTIEEYACTLTSMMLTGTAEQYAEFVWIAPRRFTRNMLERAIELTGATNQRVISAWSELEVGLASGCDIYTEYADPDEEHKPEAKPRAGSVRSFRLPRNRTREARLAQERQAIEARNNTTPALNEYGHLDARAPFGANRGNAAQRNTTSEAPVTRSAVNEMSEAPVTRNAATMSDARTDVLKSRTTRADSSFVVSTDQFPVTAAASAPAGSPVAAPASPFVTRSAAPTATPVFNRPVRRSGGNPFSAVIGQPAGPVDALDEGPADAMDDSAGAVAPSPYVKPVADGAASADGNKKTDDEETREMMRAIRQPEEMPNLDNGDFGFMD